VHSVDYHRRPLGGVEDGVYSLDSDLIASIREELDRLHRLTEDLSGLSRAEESAYKLHRARTDLAALSEEVTSRLRPQFTHAAAWHAPTAANSPPPLAGSAGGQP
jgi:signal transduction histidine kinase